jgi:hypothetical protein
LSSALKASRRPSGDGRASRIWATVSVESLISYWNFTTGPSACATCAVKGSCAVRPVATSMRTIFPPAVARSARLSGVNVIPGIRSRVKRDSWSSFCTLSASHRSSPVASSRRRSAVFRPCRVA